MGYQIALLRDDCEVFLTKSSVPLKLGTDISEIRQLDSLGYLGVDNDGAEPNSVLHQLHFDAVSSSKYVQQLSSLLVLDDLVIYLTLEGVDAGSRLKGNLQVMFLLWVYHDVTTWCDTHEVLFQVVYLVVHV